jgi:hypothetical protein
MMNHGEHAMHSGRTLQLLLSVCGLALLACSRTELGTGDTPTPAKAAAELPHAASDCRLKSGRIVSDTTLAKACSPYKVRGGIDVLENATLTIEPGVEVRFTGKDWLEISAAGTHGGKLIARGTPEEPIVLTSMASRNGSSGTWLGLWFNAGTAKGSILSHAIVRAAGGNNKFIKPTPVQGCITLTDVAQGAVTIEDVGLENCVNAGIVLRNSQPQLSRVSMRDMQTGLLVSESIPDSALGSVHFTNVAKQILREP